MHHNSPTNRFFPSQTSPFPAHRPHPQPYSDRIPSHKQPIPTSTQPSTSSRARTSTNSLQPISSLKSQLYSLKNDFNELFLKQDIQPESTPCDSYLKPKLHHKKPSRKFEEADPSEMSYPSQSAIEEQNLALRSEIKRMQLRYSNKKQEYEQTIKLLYHKIQQMAQQLETNEQSLMVCKMELEGEMESIREQLRGKKEAEISLEDYGELVEINGNLKGEIQCYLKSIEEMKIALEIEYRRAGEMERERSVQRLRIEELEGALKMESTKKQGWEKERQERVGQNKKLLEQVRQLQQINSSLKGQLQSTQQFYTTSTSQLQQLTIENTALRTQSLQYLQTIGEINAECFLFRNNYQTILQQHQKCNPVNPQHIQKLQHENLKQKQIMEDMIKFIKQLEEIKYKLEIEREAMLSDIMFFERELGKRDEEIGMLRMALAERESEVVGLRERVGEMERSGEKEKQRKRREEGEVKQTATVFVQSQEVSDEVIKDFEGLLNSPKIEQRKNVGFYMIPQVVEYEIETLSIGQPNNTHNPQSGQPATLIPQTQTENTQGKQFVYKNLGDLKRYISQQQDQSQLAVSIIVSDNKSQVPENEKENCEDINDELLLVENEKEKENVSGGNHELNRGGNNE